MYKSKVLQLKIIIPKKPFTLKTIHAPTDEPRQYPKFL